MFAGAQELIAGWAVAGRVLRGHICVQKRQVAGMKECVFLPNLHADPSLLDAHIGASKVLRWLEKKGVSKSKGYLVLADGVEIVCGGGALGSARGGAAVTKVRCRQAQALITRSLLTSHPAFLGEARQRPDGLRRTVRDLQACNFLRISGRAWRGGRQKGVQRGKRGTHRIAS